MSLLDKPVSQLEHWADHLRHKLAAGLDGGGMHQAELDEVESILRYKRELSDTPSAPGKPFFV